MNTSPSNVAADHPRTFASDNYSGRTRVIEAVITANIGHAPSYGTDAWTVHFEEVARGLFGPDAESLPVFNGTGANVLALQAGLPLGSRDLRGLSPHLRR